MIVRIMGAVYKFSKRAWKNFLEKWYETGEMPDIERFATCIGISSLDITDLGIEDVRYHLEDAYAKSCTDKDFKSKY